MPQQHPQQLDRRGLHGRAAPRRPLDLGGREQQAQGSRQHHAPLAEGHQAQEHAVAVLRGGGARRCLQVGAGWVRTSEQQREFGLSAEPDNRCCRWLRLPCRRVEGCLTQRGPPKGKSEAARQQHPGHLTL